MTETLTRPDPATPPAPERVLPERAWLAVLFSVTGFLGAALLFVVQPMVAKLVLPSYGGSPTVWSTTSLFFQVLLLGGYLYTHWSTRRLGARLQPRLHVLVLLLPLLALPLTLPTSAVPGPDAAPALWLLRTLLLMIGLPFVVLATTGPLLQRWYAWGDGPRSEDPYFLFAASNLGSFGGLLAYPFAIEPHLSLAQQRWWWSVGFVAFVVLVAGCGLAVGRGSGAARGAAGTGTGGATRPTRSTLALWGALAFLPSSLMLAMTAHLSTDVAAIPLLWVVPLAVYLATFVLAFARSTRRPPVLATRAAVAATVATAVLSVLGTRTPIEVVLAVNLATMALVGYAAHARLATLRPDPAHLTAFYLVVACGGALGGLLNGLLAPAALDRVWEFGLTLAAVPLLLVGAVAPRDSWLTRRRFHPAFASVVRTLLVLGAGVLLLQLLATATRHGIGAVLGAVALVALAGWFAAGRPLPLAVGLVTCTIVVGLLASHGSLAVERTFFGSYRVLAEPGQHALVHGTTRHGTQFTDAQRRGLPTTYYAQDGPLGDVFGSGRPDRVGVVGLGAGTVAAYGRAGQTMTFFEIDSQIVDFARDTRLFTYLADSPADVEVRVGDGRLLLGREPDGAFDLLVLDAFSSDAIPAHLLTREAMREYARTLAPGGAMAVHISNRVFNLEPVLAAAAADLGWAGVLGEGGSGPGAAASTWVLLTPSAQRAAALVEGHDWRALDPGRVVRWSDDYSSVLSVLR